MKKVRLLAALGILVALVVAILPGQALADGAVSVVAPEEVPEGGTFTAYITVDWVEDLDSGQFELAYNNAVIELTDLGTGVRRGMLLPETGTTVLASQPAAGIVRVIFDATTSPITGGVTGTGCLVEIDFDVVGEYCETSPLDLAPPTGFQNGMWDNWAMEIPSTWADGAVHVCHPRTLVSGIIESTPPFAFVPTDEFNPGDTVAVYGYGFLPDEPYDMYIQPYEMNLHVDEGDTLDSVADPRLVSPQPVISSGLGEIGPVVLWAIPASGYELTYWEIVADDTGASCSGSGMYNAAEDGLDALALNEEGFYVVPEALTIVLFSLGLVGVGGYYFVRRRRHPEIEA
jgi:hypothetical protein